MGRPALRYVLKGVIWAKGKYQIYTKNESSRSGK